MKKSICVILSMVLILSLFTSCDSNSSSDGTTASVTTVATLNSEDKIAIESIELNAELLENPVIKWLSFWDLNPTQNKAASVALELLESKYGGRIEYIPTTWDEKFNALATLVASGDSPDMFPAADMDLVPRAVISNLLKPLDGYLDFSAPEWEDVANINEQFMFQGNHYMAVTSIDAGVVCIYNKNTIEENGLEDPAALYAEGKWDWNTFYDMMLKFCNREDNKFAIDGWWFESAFALSTGVPYIGLENGKVVQNLDSSLIEKAQEFMQKIKQQDFPVPKAEYNWIIQPKLIGDGKTLFYPVGIWQLYQSNLEEFGETGDIMFVPIPKCPDTDEYYSSITISAYALVAGAENPEGVAAFLECVRAETTSEESKIIGEKQLLDEYKWTQEMLDMHKSIQELCQKNPVIEFYNAINSDLYDLVNNETKRTYNEGASWTQIKEEIRYSVDAEIEKANVKIVNN